MKLRSKIVLMGVLPLVALTVIICGLCYYRISDTLQEKAKTDLSAMNRLVETNISIYVAGMNSNNFTLDDKGTMRNGNMNVAENLSHYDEVKEMADIDFTVFFGDTRIVTTLKDPVSGDRLKGTQAADHVVQKVLVDGEVYFSDNEIINGEAYYAYYSPICNASDPETPIGMIFCGMPSDSIRADILNIIIIIVAISVAVMAICIVIILTNASSISKRLNRGVKALSQLADGDLSVRLDPKMFRYRDEVGDISKAIRNVRDKLIAIVGDIVSRSDEVQVSSETLGRDASDTSTAVEQVERAMLDISEGASSQAADTQQATNTVMTMGEMIEMTNGQVEKLRTNSDYMEQKSFEAKRVLSELQNINSQASGSIELIYEQTNKTNVSAAKISEATGLITDIAEETNLLSLNASIEAARAGEAGRGFAVVATQIQKLAEQSTNSAKRIEEIITMLKNDAEESVQTMDTVREIMRQQSDMVDKTTQIFDEVAQEIDASRRGIDGISESTLELDKSRVDVVDIVQNLSAIAEQNAASTAQTSENTAQVSMNVQGMTDSATELQGIAHKLKDSVSVFKL